MKIKVRLGKASEAIKELESFKKNLNVKIKIFCERLAEIGVETASVRFKTAQYDGTNDVIVQSPRWEGNKLVVSAKGNSVTFIEFGTGIRYTEIHPKAAEMGAVRGAYGKGKGNRDTWGYYGETGTNGKLIRELGDGTPVVLTHGNPPARAMYEASKEMRANIAKIAKEVFGSD